jgi:Flp pilus assembly protein TadD
VSLDPKFVQAWSALSGTCAVLYGNSAPTPELARRVREAAEKAAELAPNRPEGYLALGRYHDYVGGDFVRAEEQYAKALQLAPTNVDVMTSRASTEESLGRWDTALELLRQAERLDPRSITTLRRLGVALLYTRHATEARAAFDHALALSPGNVGIIEYKAVSYLMEGDLVGARSVLASESKEIEPAALVAFVAQFYDLVWVLDDAQRQLLLGLKPSSFDDDPAAWGLSLTQAYALDGDAGNAVRLAEQTVRAFEEQMRQGLKDPQRIMLFGVSLAYAGRKEEAVREGLRAAAMLPISKDAYVGPYVQHQLARLFVLVGDQEKALDQLEPLLNVPYVLTPGWLKIDPTFGPLRQNPRFQRLLAGAK